MLAAPAKCLRGDGFCEVNAGLDHELALETAIALEWQHPPALGISHERSADALEVARGVGSVHEPNLPVCPVFGNS